MTELDTTRYAALNAEFPQVLETIKLFWGYKEMYAHLDKLTIQDRPNLRGGFPPAVLRDLHKLRCDHQQLVPEHQMLQTDKWMHSSN